MKSWEVGYHFADEPTKSSSKRLRTGDTQEEAISFLKTLLTPDHAGRHLIVRYCVPPTDNKQYIDKVCSHCRRPYQEVVNLGKTMPKGWLQNDNDCWIEGGVL